MASTGEVASFGKDVREAYWASLMSTTGFKLPRPGKGILIGGDVNKPEMATISQGLLELGFKLYCSSEEVEVYLNNLPNVICKKILFPKKDKRKLRQVFDEFEIQCVINIAKSRATTVVDEDYVARRYVHFIIGDPKYKI